MQRDLCFYILCNAANINRKYKCHRLQEEMLSDISRPPLKLCYYRVVLKICVNVCLMEI